MLFEFHITMQFGGELQLVNRYIHEFSKAFLSHFMFISSHIQTIEEVIYTSKRTIRLECFIILKSYVMSSLSVIIVTAHFAIQRL